MTFNYEGHIVRIEPRPSKKGTRYWFLVDGRPVTYASNPDTAKRLATRFIDVVSDSQFKTSKQVPLRKPGWC